MVDTVNARSTNRSTPYGQKIETVDKDGELSIPGVASLGGAGYDFWGQSIANRLARRTNGLGCAEPSRGAGRLGPGLPESGP
jgi:hypothetical protein